MPQDNADESTKARRPLVAVAYGPRCVPIMQLTEAAAGVCELLWLVDGSVPEMQEMTDLLHRFGPVVDIAGLSIEEILTELTSPYKPNGIVTYLDANMDTFARVADALDLPFHSLATAIALTDKAHQRSVLSGAGISGPAFVAIASHETSSDLALSSEMRWPAVLKPRSAQGSRYTFLVNDQSELDQYLSALGPARPDMLLEVYLADDPRRAVGPFADYVSVESIVAHGTISHLALTGRFPLAEHFRETGFFIPAALSESDRTAVLEMASSSIKALGVTTGCLHTEIKFTPGGPRVIEVNGRVGGGVPEMLGRAAGIALIEMTLRVALGESMEVSGPVPTERIGYRFFLQPPPVSATVAAINGVDALSDQPGVDSITIHQGPGAVLDWKDGSRNHIMAVVGSAGSYDELRRVNELLHEEVTITYANVGLEG